MRGFLILGLLVLTGHAAALETSAGADTVNSSQVGINAKLDASNVVMNTVVNQINNCHKTGQLFDPVSKACIAVDEPLAKKIAACTTQKKFYDQNSGNCLDSAPDLSNALNTTNSNLSAMSALMAKMAACYNSGGSFNVTTGVCTAGGGGSLVHQVFAAGAHGNHTLNIPGQWDACSLTQEYADKDHRTQCVINEIATKTWQMYADDQFRVGGQCAAVCVRGN